MTRRPLIFNPLLPEWLRVNGRSGNLIRLKCLVTPCRLYGLRLGSFVCLALRFGVLGCEVGGYIQGFPFLSAAGVVPMGIATLGYKDFKTGRQRREKITIVTKSLHIFCKNII